MVNDATVVLADVPASNGVIHVIDKVLMPPADEPAVTEADGDICYNMVTHTVRRRLVRRVHGICILRRLRDERPDFHWLLQHCNTHLHYGKSAECEAYMWTPAVDIAMTASATTIHNSLVAHWPKPN